MLAQCFFKKKIIIHRTSYHGMLASRVNLLPTYQVFSKPTEPVMLIHLIKWYLQLCRNLRLFISLLCMDTQLSINNSLVSKIKSEALPFGLFEAFLEAAPQLIFQLSLVLRTGYICKYQPLVSSVPSIASVALHHPTSQCHNYYIFMPC